MKDFRSFSLLFLSGLCASSSLSMEVNLIFEILEKVSLSFLFFYVI